MAISVVVPGGTGRGEVKVDLEGAEVFGPYYIDVLQQYGNTKAAMASALAQAAEFEGAPCAIWLQPNGPDGYDWGDGDFGEIATDNLTIIGEYGATVINITENTVGPLFWMTGTQQSIFGVTVAYNDHITSMVGPTVYDNGTIDLIVKSLHTINGPAIATVDTSSRAFYENLVGEGWRPSVGDQQDWFLINFAKSLHVYHPKMTSPDQGVGDAYVAFRSTHLTQTIDTVLFEFTAGGAPQNAQAYGLIMDSTGGPIVNVWFNKGVFDRATSASIFLTSGVGGKAMQNIHFDGLHVAPYGSPCVKIDWQSDDNFGNVVFSNLLAIQGTFGQSTAVPIQISATGNSLGLFKGPRFNGGTIVNVSKLSDTGTGAQYVIESNASFWMNGMNYELRDTADDLEANKQPTYFLHETADFDYIIESCNIEGVVSGGNLHFTGRTMPYVVANNIGLSEDTNQTYAVTTASAYARGATTPQAVAFFASLVTNGATLTDARLAIYNTFIASLISGGIWSLTGLLYLPAAADEASALTSLITPNFNRLTRNGTLTFVADRGYTPDGATGYLEQIKGISDCGATLNNMGLFAWSGTDTAVTDSYIVGTPRENLIRINPRASGNKIVTRANDLTNTSTTASATAIGGFGVFRTGSANYIEAVNNVEATITQASTSLSTAPIRLNYSFGSPNHFDARVAAGLWAGQYLDGTKRTALFNAFHTYMAAIGAPV